MGIVANIEWGGIIIFLALICVFFAAARAMGVPGGVIQIITVCVIAVVALYAVKFLLGI